MATRHCHSCRGRAPSCLGQEAPAWLQADGPLMLLQTLEFGWMEMDGWILSGINNPHPPQRLVSPSGAPLNLLALPLVASLSAPFLLSVCRGLSYRINTGCLSDVCQARAGHFDHIFSFAPRSSLC